MSQTFLIKNRLSSVMSCHRCGADHDGLVFKAFSCVVEPDDSQYKWTHWATCPVTGDPILMRDWHHRQTEVKEAVQ